MNKRIALVLPVGLFLHLASCSEKQESYYPNYADAVRDGAVNRGWIPAFVPPSASEIHEAHDLDTNVQRLRFRVPPSDARLVTRQMIPQTMSEIQALQEELETPSLSVPWPPELQNGGQSATMSLGLFATPASDRPSFCVAVEWTTGWIYAWSCRRQ